MATNVLRCQWDPSEEYFCSRHGGKTRGEIMTLSFGQYLAWQLEEGAERPPGSQQQQGYVIWLRGKIENTLKKDRSQPDTIHLRTNPPSNTAENIKCFCGNMHNFQFTALLKHVAPNRINKKTSERRV